MKKDEKKKIEFEKLSKGLKNKKLEMKFKNFHYKDLELNGELCLKKTKSNIIEKGKAKITIKNFKEEKLAKVIIDNEKKIIKIIIFDVIGILKDFSFIKFVLNIRKFIKKDKGYKFKLNLKLLRKQE